jgi:hypothetical protein
MKTMSNGIGGRPLYLSKRKKIIGPSLEISAIFLINWLIEAWREVKTFIFRKKEN